MGDIVTRTNLLQYILGPSLTCPHTVTRVEAGDMTQAPRHRSKLLLLDAICFPGKGQGQGGQNIKILYRNK